MQKLLTDLTEIDLEHKVFRPRRTSIQQRSHFALMTEERLEKVCLKMIYNLPHLSIYSRVSDKLGYARLETTHQNEKLFIQFDLFFSRLESVCVKKLVDSYNLFQ